MGSVPPERARALALLWMNKRGKAIDLVHWLRRHPKDPRNAHVADLLDAAEKLEERLHAQDLEGATDKADVLERLLRKVDETELEPFVKKARAAKKAEAKAVEQTHGSEQERLAKRERRRALFRAERARGIPIMQAYKNVAKTEGVDRKTIQRAVTRQE